MLDAAVELARSPLVPVLAGVLVAGLVAVLLVRCVLERRALADRVRLELVPADSFAPEIRPVLAFASTLTAARRATGGLLAKRAHAVRVRLDNDPDGRLRYSVELPRHARRALEVGVGSYGGVELRELPAPAPARPPEPNPTQAPTPPAQHATVAPNSTQVDAEPHVARAELILARDSRHPLLETGVDPDPLTGFAQALEPLIPKDESAEVCVDLLPLKPSERRRLQGKLLRKARREERREQKTLGEIMRGEPAHRTPPTRAELVARRAEHKSLAGKLGDPLPLFGVQVLVRASSPLAGRAVEQVGALVAAFRAFDGENHFRVVGQRVPFGFAGADAPWRRGRFDARVAGGLFAPARKRLVNAEEVAALLKPPTKSCESENVVRSGGRVPAAPRGLPTFDHQPDLLPLGRVVSARAGERLVGVPLRGSFFTYVAGRSRFGKTETGIGQFLHLARNGHGCFFLDPHADALEKIKRHLGDQLDRVIELDLTDHHAGPQIGWNPLARTGHRTTQQRVDAIVDAFSSTMRWDEVNARAINLTAQAAHALADLADRLPAAKAPTVFQIPTLLGDDDWRATVLPHVSPPVRQFFEQRFARLSPEAITPVTNLIDRLRTAPAAAAVLGNPQSAYDVGAAMDAGAIVLACPGSGSSRDRLLANFLVYDLLHTAKQRAALHPSAHKPFHVFLDEIQIYDGATSGNLAALLEQTAKYGIRGFLFNQNPERLTRATRDAITTNRSHLLTTALDASAANQIAREWAGRIEPQTIVNLDRFTFLASVTLDGHPTPPFLLHGVPVSDLYPEPTTYPAGPLPFTAAHGIPIAETLDRLATLDDEIAAHFAPAGERADAPAEEQVTIQAEAPQ
ncbi:hypothetical protein [Conexibacter arvalis]|uniref:hypothetical protein n=1 Tax=Conexibacter arvalis TaxID=912552 RepID=UPI001618A991|nr:hypothetical protein [Conexibacter arvalis]